VALVCVDGNSGAFYVFVGNIVNLKKTERLSFKTGRQEYKK
jgi:hypothetical protein